MLGNFIDETGEFRLSLSKDIRGMLSLHEASYLNTGEEILYKAKEFSGKHLKSCISNSEPNLARLITGALEHPYHISLQQYKARHYLSYRQKLLGGNGAIEELAVMDFSRSEQLYLKELKEFTNWWRRLGLAQNRELARNQVLKWYSWSTTILQGPHFSKYRVQMAKVVTFIYILDDIYDVVGSLDELPLFTEAINKWEHPSNNSLPDYMRMCYAALHDTTNEIANIITKEHGWNPIDSLKRVWAALCNSFMVEAKWFAAKHIPTTDDYLKNGTISTGARHRSALILSIRARNNEQDRRFY
ncbi:terpene synthase 2, chloroplastic-like [Typha angustifolia]|uniref:terpene synthase 2, chloroplastic-like n=1 Tax=Typha angustifolia TaxID=59011 RepID=UPI003C2E0CE1